MRGSQTKVEDAKRASKNLNLTQGNNPWVTVERPRHTALANKIVVSKSAVFSDKSHNELKV